MPKVTLLAEPWTNYTLIHGMASYEFHGGEPLDVPVHAALICSKKRDQKGNCLFKIDDMPEVVEHACVVDTTKINNAVEQNVIKTRHSIAFVQPRLMRKGICL